MYSCVKILVVASAMAAAATQYNDGYEIVDTDTAPVQIRVAYQGPSAMMVSWNTFAQLSSPTVSYGLSADNLDLTASSSVSVTYATSLTYNNHVNLTGLLPYTTYYYLPQYSNATTPYTFTTSREAGDTTPYTVGYVADMGTFGALGLSTVVGTGAANPLRVNEQTTIAALTEKLDDYEFLIHAGDIAYADYWLKEEIQDYLPTTTTEEGAVVYEHILNAFFDEIAGISSAKAYMVSAGNHDANCDNGGTTNKTSGVKYTESICLAGQTNFTGYINHWRMPSGPSGGLGNFWFSYDYGLAHFVHIDTETDLGNGLVGPDEDSPEYGGPFGSYNEQIDWLTSDLAAVNRTLTPWVVVFGHRGWYLSASGSVCANCQTAFESIFHEYEVDLYMNGHAHLYERTVPIYDDVVDPNGLDNPSSTLYITNGAAGHYDGLDSFTTIESYSAYHEASDYAWTTLSFLNATHLAINTLWSANNTVFDTATLYKAHNSSSSIISASSSTTSASTTTTKATATTNSTATTTASDSYPTYTNFNGQGHLYVFSGGEREGDIGSGGTWYNTPGQNTATYTAVPLYSNNTAFLLQHSSDYCTITDNAFGCGVTESSEATVFGQTSEGNLTYSGVAEFYASSSASSGAKPTVYVSSLPVTLNIVWGGTTTLTATSSTTTTTTKPTTATASSTTSATTALSTSSSAATTSSASSVSTSTKSASSSTSATATSTLSNSTAVTSTSAKGTTVTFTATDDVTATSTVIDGTTVTSTFTDGTTLKTTFIDGTTVTSTSTDVVYQTSTKTETLPAVTVTVRPPVSTVTIPARIVTDYSSETIVSTTTRFVYQTIVSTTSITDIKTAVVSRTVTSTATKTDVVTRTVMSTATKTDVVTRTVVSTATKTDHVTRTVTSTATKTHTVTTTTTVRKAV